MRFLAIVLSDALVLAALGFAGWTLYKQMKARRDRGMCPGCRDLSAIRANDNVCPGCGQLHLKP